MRPPRVSILGMMAWMAGVLFSFAALRFSTPNMASFVVPLTLLGLGLATVAAIGRRESRRAYFYCIPYIRS